MGLEAETAEKSVELKTVVELTDAGCGGDELEPSSQKLSFRQ